MKHCIYCNPDKDEEKEPILNTPNTLMCVVGFTPIGNRKKSGILQILDKVSMNVTSADIERCPMCGQLLYIE